MTKKVRIRATQIAELMQTARPELREQRFESVAFDFEGDAVGFVFAFAASNPEIIVGPDDPPPEPPSPPPPEIIVDW